MNRVLFHTESQLVQPAVERDRVLMGLYGAIAGLGLAVPVMLPQTPLPMKTGMLAAALGGSVALALTAKQAEQRQDFTARIKKARLAMLDNQMKSQIALNFAEQEVISQQEILAMVLRLPVEQQPYWLNHYGLWGLIQSPQMAVASPASAPNPNVIDITAHPVSQTMAKQMGVEQAIANSIQPSTDWFQGWEKRSGIICGESKDGKTRLSRYRLLRFLENNQNEPSEIYIGDPDYGSSHDDGEPNDWFGLEVDRHVYITPQKIFNMTKHVSGIVDQRAEETAIAFSRKQAAPEKFPILLIIDELPAVVSGLGKEQKELFVEYVCNILRRGLKQRVIFSLGTQTLAVSRTGLNQDILQQLETVMLWRAAQVEANYRNLGLRDGEASKAAEAIAQLPKKMGDVFVCVTFIDKRLSIRGIPTINQTSPAQSAPVPEDSYQEWDSQYEDQFGNQPEAEIIPEPASESASVATSVPSQNPFKEMCTWFGNLNEFPNQDEINQKWHSLTQTNLSEDGLGLLLQDIARHSERDKYGFSHFYRLYLRSKRWQDKRSQRLELDSCRCQCCNSTDNLEVNHRTYDNLGNESLEDLITLCHTCHEGVTQSMRSQRKKK